MSSHNAHQASPLCGIKKYDFVSDSMKQDLGELSTESLDLTSIL